MLHRLASPGNAPFVQSVCCHAKWNVLYVQSSQALRRSTEASRCRARATASGAAPTRRQGLALPGELDAPSAAAPCVFCAGCLPPPPPPPPGQDQRLPCSAGAMRTDAVDIVWRLDDARACLCREMGPGSPRRGRARGLARRPPPPRRPRGPPAATPMRSRPPTRPPPLRTPGQ